MPMDLISDLRTVIKGDVDASDETLAKYSRDASIFEVRPKVVVFPRDSEDVKNLVKFVNENKEKHPELSLTARSGGTDMSGGPLGESIIVEFDKYFNRIIKIEESNGKYENFKIDGYATVEPGVYYRDFEKETLKKGLIFPSYPASKSICAIGGIISNNSGGEKTLMYGKTDKYVLRLKIVLADGNEYEIKRISRDELQKKRAEENFEGTLYGKVFELIENNYDAITKAKPGVSKNSAGYYLWNVWDKESFDLSQVLVGSQGTLGLVTEVDLGLVKKKKHSRLVVVFLKDVKSLADLVNAVLPSHPESLETFDDNTLKLAIKFMPDIAKKLGGKGFLSLALSFIGETFMVLTHGLPKFVVLVELTSNEEKDIEERILKLHNELDNLGIPNKPMKSERDGEKYWVIRRESFNLLRKRVKSKQATPFVDDIIVDPAKLPEVLPELYKILEVNGISPTLAGHAGDGNFHIIPLMDLSRDEDRKKIPVVAAKVHELILRHGGSITAEHNDGLIRSPYLEKMYGSEIFELFKRVKNIFDPNGIFNPGKKVGSDLDYALEHIKRS